MTGLVLPFHLGKPAEEPVSAASSPAGDMLNETWMNTPFSVTFEIEKPELKVHPAFSFFCRRLIKQKAIAASQAPNLQPTFL